MSSIYPKRNIEKTVETDQMRLMISKTLGVHPLGSLVVWAGRSRLGKTTTAATLNQKLNGNFSSDDPDAFRSVHYTVGEVNPGNLQKKGIRSLYHACIGQMEEAVYRRNPAEDLARMTVEALRVKNIKMVFIDEAGNLPLEAIRGMVLVRDTAQAMGWTLSLVFVGMDDLPVKLVQLPQIHHRIHEWCYFKPYSLEETLFLLQQLEPRFSCYSLEDPDQRQQIEFIHEQFDGRPGLIVPFLRRLKNRLYSDLGGVIDLPALMAVHLNFLRDKDAAISDYQNSYTGVMEPKSAQDLLASQIQPFNTPVKKRNKYAKP
jgi:hypothetical protein